MFALLLIPLLASGQIIISSPYLIRTYFRLHRYDGQLLYMKVATFGISCLILSISLAYFVKWVFPSLTVATWLVGWIDLSNDPKENRLASWLILLSLCMVIVAKVWTQVGRLGLHVAAKILSSMNDGESRTDDAKQSIRLWAIKELLSDGSLGRLFFDSATTGKPILVSLKSKKVYVGIINTISEPNEKQGPNIEVSINPLLSGYREKDNLRVLFTNDYSDLEGVDTSVTFPLTEVAQASWFDMDTHEKVDNNRQPKPISNRKRKRQGR